MSKIKRENKKIFQMYPKNTKQRRKETIKVEQNLESDPFQFNRSHSSLA